MQRQIWPSDNHPPPQLIRRLDRVLGEINAFLVAVAIGLAVLDATCFAALSASTEIARTRQSRIFRGSVAVTLRTDCVPVNEAAVTRSWIAKDPVQFDAAFELVDGPGLRRYGEPRSDSTCHGHALVEPH